MTVNVTASSPLGAFIRLHRERLAPQQAGVPGGGRRRTPGLRREELAQLAGVSATWVTWLEQGRAEAASPGALDRLSRALQLTAAERAYLFELAGRLDPAAPTPDDTAGAAVLRSVGAIDAPVYVLDRTWDIVAANARARDLFLDWDRPTPGARPNLLRFLFCTEHARTLIADWPHRARRLVAEFRADAGARAAEPPLSDFVAALSAASADFAACWAALDVQTREGGERRFHHPSLGDCAFEQLTLRPALRGDLKLVLLLPPAGQSRNTIGP